MPASSAWKPTTTSTRRTRSKRKPDPVHTPGAPTSGSPGFSFVPVIGDPFLILLTAGDRGQGKEGFGITPHQINMSRALSAPMKASGSVPEIRVHLCPSVVHSSLIGGKTKTGAFSVVENAPVRPAANRISVSWPARGAGLLRFRPTTDAPVENLYGSTHPGRTRPCVTPAPHFLVLPTVSPPVGPSVLSKKSRALGTNHWLLVLLPTSHYSLTTSHWPLIRDRHDHTIDRRNPPLSRAADSAAEPARKARRWPDWSAR